MRSRWIIPHRRQIQGRDCYHMSTSESLRLQMQRDCIQTRNRMKCRVASRHYKWNFTRTERKWHLSARNDWWASNGWFGCVAKLSKNSHASCTMHTGASKRMFRYKRKFACNTPTAIMVMENSLHISVAMKIQFWNHFPIYPCLLHPMCPVNGPG